jgi:hypothetical protein
MYRWQACVIHTSRLQKNSPKGLNLCMCACMCTCEYVRDAYVHVYTCVISCIDDKHVNHASTTEELPHVQMRVHMCTCMCIHLQVYLHVNNASRLGRTPTCTCVYAYVYMYVYTCASLCIDDLHVNNASTPQKNSHMYMCVYIYTYTYIHICMYMH